jgi:hypothetical protein
MEIKIDLNDLGFKYDEDGDPAGRNTLTDAIIDEAARKLVNSLVSQREVTDKMNQKINEMIDERVAGMVEAAFEQPVQRTTRWGERQGEPTTVREIIREAIEKYLNAPARGRDGYTRDPKNLTELVEDAVRDAMNRDLKATVEAAKANVHNTVTKKALEAAVAVLAK